MVDPTSSRSGNAVDGVSLWPMPRNSAQTDRPSHQRASVSANAVLDTSSSSSANAVYGVKSSTRSAERPPRLCIFSQSASAVGETYPLIRTVGSKIRWIVFVTSGATVADSCPCTRSTNVVGAVADLKYIVPPPPASTTSTATSTATARTTSTTFFCCRTAGGHHRTAPCRTVTSRVCSDTTSEFDCSTESAWISESIVWRCGSSPQATFSQSLQLRRLSDCCHLNRGYALREQICPYGRVGLRGVGISPPQHLSGGWRSPLVPVTIFGGKHRKVVAPDRGPEGCYESSGKGYGHGYWRSSRPLSKPCQKQVRPTICSEEVHENTTGVTFNHKRYQRKRLRYEYFWHQRLLSVQNEARDDASVGGSDTSTVNDSSWPNKWYMRKSSCSLRERMNWI